MALYRCRFCGSQYDEEKKGVPVSRLNVCPVCGVSAKKMALVEEPAGAVSDSESGEEKMGAAPAASSEYGGSPAADGKMSAIHGQKQEDLSYPPELIRRDTGGRYMEEIHQMAVSGRSIIAPMGTKKPMPG